jgi:hypothetical protein
MRILNASPSFGSTLNEQEIKDFLTNSKLNVHLGTVDEKHEPNIHPIWYYYDSLNNKLYVETYKESKKFSNIKKNNTVYFCIDEPNPPYKGEKIMVKYFGDLENPGAKQLLSFIKKGDSVMLEITPEYFSTWDYSKIG